MRSTDCFQMKCRTVRKSIFGSSDCKIQNNNLNEFICFHTTFYRQSFCIYIPHYYRIVQFYPLVALVSLLNCYHFDLIVMHCYSLHLHQIRHLKFYPAHVRTLFDIVKIRWQPNDPVNERKTRINLVNLALLEVADKKKKM